MNRNHLISLRFLSALEFVLESLESSFTNSQYQIYMKLSRLNLKNVEYNDKMLMKEVRKI